MNNEGIIHFSTWLPNNKTLQFLDISRNSFNNQGFEAFATLIACNEGIVTLDISKNKEITDEGSLCVLATSLAKNSSLRTLDLIGIRLRKPFLNNYLAQALKTNIAMTEILGKIPPSSI